jgi:hypothetical protein
MKVLVAGLIGSGAGAIVLLTYLSLGQQQEAKQDIAVDKAAFEVERASFDKDFEEKWQAFDSKPLSQSVVNEHGERMKAAQEQLRTLRAQRDFSSQQNERTFEELRAAIESADTGTKKGNKP